MISLHIFEFFIFIDKDSFRSSFFDTFPKDSRKYFKDFNIELESVLRKKLLNGKPKVKKSKKHKKVRKKSVTSSKKKSKKLRTRYNSYSSESDSNPFSKKIKEEIIDFDFNFNNYTCEPSEDEEEEVLDELVELARFL